MVNIRSVCNLFPICKYLHRTQFPSNNLQPAARISEINCNLILLCLNLFCHRRVTEKPLPIDMPPRKQGEPPANDSFVFWVNVKLFPGVRN